MHQQTPARSGDAPAQERRTPTAGPAAGTSPVVRSPAAMLALQRSAGNRAVAGALRRRTPVRPPAPAPASPVSASPVSAAPASPASDVTAQRGLLDDIADGVSGLTESAAAGALETVADYAREIPGYGLLCTVLGRDVISDRPVARSAAALIDGFLDLIPGADRIRQNLAESGATERAGTWVEQEVPKLGLDWATIKALFSRAWDALDVTDLLDPAAALAKVQRVFAAPLRRLRDFAVAAGRKLLEFVFEGAMTLAGGAGSRIMGIFRQAGAVFDQIVADPVRFVGNLVSAVRGGLSAFMTNIVRHLQTGLVGWLTGSLGGIVRIPQRFDLAGVLGMAMDLLGLTWSRVRGRLVRLIPEPVVAGLEQAAGIVADLHERGLAAITDRIAQFTEGILDTVIGGIRDWVANSVVGAAITRLISMFNPAGAVVQAVIAIYNTVQFFVERAQQLASLASAVFDSITAIASGNLSQAIEWVEQALGRAVPNVLAFLARLIGLGDVAAPVRGVVERVQGVIDSALDRVIGWVAGVARRAGAALGLGGRAPDARRADGGAGDASLTSAVAAGNAILNRPDATEASVRSGLPGLRQQHQLRSADLVPGPMPGSFRIHVQRSDETDLAQLRPLTAEEVAEVDIRAGHLSAGQTRPRRVTDQLAGRASGAAHCRSADAGWLRAGRAVDVFPRQIAVLMNNRTYGSWREFREEFWRLVAASPLAGHFAPWQWSPARQAAGHAPLATRPERGRGITYQISHQDPVSHGADTMNMANLEIVTPRAHQHLEGTD
jgi:hypothetical protein